MVDCEVVLVVLVSVELQGVEGQFVLVEVKFVCMWFVVFMDGFVVIGDWVQQFGGLVELGKEMFEIVFEGYCVVLYVFECDIVCVCVGQYGVLWLVGQLQMGYDFEFSCVMVMVSVQDGVNGFCVEVVWIGEVLFLSFGMQGVVKVVVGCVNLLMIWICEFVDWLWFKFWQYWIQSDVGVVFGVLVCIVLFQVQVV